MKNLIFILGLIFLSQTLLTQTTFYNDGINKVNAYIPKSDNTFLTFSYEVSKTDSCLFVSSSDSIALSLLQSLHSGKKMDANRFCFPLSAEKSIFLMILK